MNSLIISSEYSPYPILYHQNIILLGPEALLGKGEVWIYNALRENEKAITSAIDFAVSHPESNVVILTDGRSSSRKCEEKCCPCYKSYRNWSRQ